jgi:hypothetical protein
MTKEEMAEGFKRGRQLTQEEWSKSEEIRAVDELAEEGKCIVTPWKYKDNFQCEVRYAKGTGK